MAKPPKTIDVGPHRYKVSTNGADLTKACKDQGSVPGELLGNCDRKQLRILLDPTSAPSMLRETLLHEVLHAVTYLTGAAEDLGDETEERLTNRLAPAILDVLRRNPDLTAYLLA